MVLKLLYAIQFFSVSLETLWLIVMFCECEECLLAEPEFEVVVGCKRSTRRHNIPTVFLESGDHSAQQ